MAVYAFSDLHGNGALWAEIKKFLKPEDKVFYLGDAADRGPDGWAILKEMLNDKRITYIAGNHDIMLADRISYPNNYRIANLHHSNGGHPTWVAAENDPEAKEIMMKIRNLPLFAVYENVDGHKVFMSHSGSTDVEDAEALIWDRSEYLSRHKPAGYDVVIHGHTTIPHLLDDLERTNRFFSDPTKKYVIPEWEGGALWYSNWRIDIDCCTIVTGQTVLLNLDTFDEEIFEI